MFDDLLGKTELKEQIEALETELEDKESEIESLEKQLDKESQRRTDAVSDRQEAEREVNQLEDRIEQLEDKIDRLEGEEVSHSYRKAVDLRGKRLDEVLSRLESFVTDAEGALSTYVAEGHDIPEVVSEAFDDRAGLVSRASPCLALTDDAGLIAACLRLPAPPAPFVEWSDRFRIDREWLQPRGTYTLALVRSDLFAMGTYHGDERTAFHGFDSDLKSQHSKGGFSQARFERLRDEQIDNHLDRCVAALEESDTDRLYVVGETSVLGEVADLADVTATVDATGDPEPALKDAWRDFWTVQLRIL